MEVLLTESDDTTLWNVFNKQCIHLWVWVWVCVHNKMHRTSLQWGLQPSSLTNCERPLRISGNSLSGRFFSFPIMPVLLFLLILLSGSRTSWCRNNCFFVFSHLTPIAERVLLFVCMSQSTGFSIFFLTLTNLFSITLTNLVLILQSKRRLPVPPAHSVQFPAMTGILAPRTAVGSWAILLVSLHYGKGQGYTPHFGLW